MTGPFGLTPVEREKLQQFVLSEENGHEFSLWTFHARTFVACRKCGVMRSNASSARFQNACKGPIKIDLREPQSSSEEGTHAAG